MPRGKEHRGDRVMEKWSDEIFNTPSLRHSNTAIVTAKRAQNRSRSAFGFALYEVLLGVAIFALGVIALGRAVQNCINASTISAEENVVRQVLSDRMAEVQAASAVPDPEKEFKINTTYGQIILNQKAAPAALTEPDNTVINGINTVTLTAHWQHAGVAESRQIQFYVYRAR